MKTLFSFLSKNRVGIFSMLILMASVAFGADASYAMADAAVDDKGLATQHPGEVVSATESREQGVTQEEIDQYVAIFRPYLFTGLSDLMKNAKQQHVTQPEQIHYRSGTDSLEFTTNSALAETSSNTATLPVSNDDAAHIPQWATIHVPEVRGYKQDSSNNNSDDGTLMLFVSAKSGNTITVEAINAKYSGTYSKLVIPAIPSGSKLVVCANACSESQMQVSPENFSPKPETKYLQKKITNIVITDQWRREAKKVDFIEQDVRDDALYKHKRKAARTLWVGKQFKKKVFVSEQMGYEMVYFQEGILRQLVNYFGYTGSLTFEDLISITKMQFTDYSVNNVADVYCGKDFMEDLLNIDFTKHKEVTFTGKTELGIDISSFKTTFGTLNFKLDPSLNDIGYSHFAVVIDTKNAVRYIIDDNKEQNIDMKDGAGETREAERTTFTQYDAICLKGYNSILVGPSSLLLDAAYGSVDTNWATSYNSLPSSPTNGDIVYLAKDKTSAVDVVTLPTAPSSGDIIKVLCVAADAVDASSLPAAPAKGNVIKLTADVDTTWNSGDILVYTGTEWVKLNAGSFAKNSYAIYNGTSWVAFNDGNFEAGSVVRYNGSSWEMYEGKFSLS